MIRLPKTNAITFEITVYFDSSNDVNGLMKSYFDSLKPHSYIVRTSIIGWLLRKNKFGPLVTDEFCTRRYHVSIMKSLLPVETTL